MWWYNNRAEVFVTLETFIGRFTSLGDVNKTAWLFYILLRWNKLLVNSQSLPKEDEIWGQVQYLPIDFLVFVAL